MYIFFLTVFSVLGFFIRKVKENLLIRREILIGGICGVIYLTSIIIITVAVKVPNLSNTFNRTITLLRYWLKGLISCTYFLIVFIFSTVMPIWLANKNEGEQKEERSSTSSESDATPNKRASMMTFSGLLKDPEQLRVFQQFLTEEFSLENLLVRSCELFSR